MDQKEMMKRMKEVFGDRFQMLGQTILHLSMSGQPLVIPGEWYTELSRNGVVGSACRRMRRGREAASRAASLPVLMCLYGCARLIGRDGRRQLTKCRTPSWTACYLLTITARDSTVELARQIGLTTFVHESNLGYGRNQKTCYREALKSV
jgi:hypothetical protein